MKVDLPTPGTPLLPGVRQQGGQQLIRLSAVVSEGGFEQRDGLGNSPALLGRGALQNAVQQGHALFSGRASHACNVGGR
jgi:hypothetical protein